MFQQMEGLEWVMFLLGGMGIGAMLAGAYYEFVQIPRRNESRYREQVARFEAETGMSDRRRR